MSRKNRERREGVEAWKQWEHEQLPLTRFRVTTCHQVINTYVVEARSESEAEELIWGCWNREQMPEPVETRDKHHTVVGAMPEGT